MLGRLCEDQLMAKLSSATQLRECGGVAGKRHDSVRQIVRQIVCQRSSLACHIWRFILGHGHGAPRGARASKGCVYGLAWQDA